MLIIIQLSFSCKFCCINIYWVWFCEIKMILPICVISLYCNIKHLFSTWKYLHKSGSSDDKCIDSQHFGTCDSHTDFKVKRSKVKATGRGILWRPPSRTACFVFSVVVMARLMLRCDHTKYPKHLFKLFRQTVVKWRFDSTRRWRVKRFVVQIMA